MQLEVNVRGPYARRALSIADESLRHDGVVCVVVVWSGKLPVHVPIRSDVPDSVGIRFTMLGALGPCVTYMFRKALLEGERRQLETLFPKATFLWRTSDRHARS